MNYLKVSQIIADIHENSRNMSKTEKLEKYNYYLHEIRKMAYRNIAEAQYNLAQHYEDIMQRRVII
jgi:hypothetical protein